MPFSNRSCRKLIDEINRRCSVWSSKYDISFSTSESPAMIWEQRLMESASDRVNMVAVLIYKYLHLESRSCVGRNRWKRTRATRILLTNSLIRRRYIQISHKWQSEYINWANKWLQILTKLAFAKRGRTENVERNEFIYKQEREKDLQLLCLDQKV